MKSVVAAPGAEGSLTIGEAPEPNPDSNEAVIKVTCFSKSPDLAKCSTKW